MHKRYEKYSYQTHSLIGCEVAPDTNPVCIAEFWISSDQMAGTYLTKISLLEKRKKLDSYLYQSMVVCTDQNNVDLTDKGLYRAISC
jgi:hypothetical protein